MLRTVAWGAMEMAEDRTIKAYNDHNVYILGAGFAQEAGLPLIKDFMNRMRDAAAWLEEQGGREDELNAISRVLDFRLKAAAAAHRVPLNVENVEDLFSLASANGDPALAEAMPLAIAATLDYARNVAPALAEHQYFSIGMLNVPGWTRPPNWRAPVAHVQQSKESGQLNGEWYGCPPYDFYLGVMGSYFNSGGPNRRDTIITFNYDMLIEQALTGLGRDFTYALGCDLEAYWKPAAQSLRVTPPRTGSIQLLKLHGSLNWGSSVANRKMMQFFQWPMVEVAGRGTDDSAPCDLVPAVQRLSGDWPLTDDFVLIYESYEALRQTNFIPLLAAPTWQKVLTGALSRVWSGAITALRTATNVVILGYSIPPTDTHFKYLLAAGLQDNISLRKVFFVNPALAMEETKRQLEERLFGLFRRELFDQDIITLVPTDIREFLAGPRIMGEESDRVRIGRPLNPPGYTWGTAPWTVFPPFQSGWSIA